MGLLETIHSPQDLTRLSGQQLSRLADEGVAEAVLFRAGRLADQHPVRVLVAHAEVAGRSR